MLGKAVIKGAKQKTVLDPTPSVLLEATMTNTKAIDDLLASYTTGPTPKLPGVALIAIRTSGASSRTPSLPWHRYSLFTPSQPLPNTGAIIYSSSSGPIAINSSKSFTTKTPCFVASMGKLPTVIAVLQCVERGQIKLDDEVESILPEVKEMDVFEGFDEDGKPKLRKAKGKITLRYVFSLFIGEPVCLDYFIKGCS
jgi:hypothetical protein